jgi:hypothetical protein
MSAEERKSVNPKVVFFAGKAAPACKRLLTHLIDRRAHAL